MMENSWNTSIRIMYNIPMQTHRNLIEPISNTRHIRFHLVKRFLSFAKQIESSEKEAAKILMKAVKHNARTTTGSNLRKILLMTDKFDVDELDPNDADSVKYHPLEKNQSWKVNLIKEAIDVKHDNLVVEGFETEKLE